MKNAELKRERRANAHIARQGGNWVKRHEEAFKLLSQGTWVCIGVDSGDYAIGQTENEASENFYRNHPPEVPTWLHWIGKNIRT